MNKTRQYEKILFNNETTYRTDFLPNKITAPIKTTYTPKPKCLYPRPAPLKYVHTLTEWKESPVRFDLFHKPKDIVRENPRKKQEIFVEESVDRDREKVQKSRPRVVMTPAVSMDDIDDQQARDLLCKDMYKTTTMIDYHGRETHYEDTPEILEIIEPVKKARGWLPPVVPKEWRKESLEWEGKQLRTYCDATKEFWLDRAKNKHT